MTIRPKGYFFGIGILFLITASCSSSDQGFANLFPASKPSNYFKISESVTVEVHYEPGAEPFVGNIGLSTTPLWNISENNIQQIFSYKSLTPEINIPKNLNEMFVLNNQNRTSWSADNVINLHQSNHVLKATNTSAVFYVYFLNGFSSTGDNVIGFSINSTPVIAVFKDVIKRSSMSVGVQRFVEQSTIVHELGHAFGLVNNGIPISSPHQENGAHTENPDCVMYWQNEGINDLRDFLERFTMDNSPVLWGPEVLADAQAFSD